MPSKDYEADYHHAKRIFSDISNNSSSLRDVAEIIREARMAERERCATVALEQRCERGTPWDRACVAIANAIRGAHD